MLIVCDPRHHVEGRHEDSPRVFMEILGPDNKTIALFPTDAPLASLNAFFKFYPYDPRLCHFTTRPIETIGTP